jgi:hypothetical protein
MKTKALILLFMCSFQLLDAFDGCYFALEFGGTLVEGKQQGLTTGIGLGQNITPANLRQREIKDSGKVNLYLGYGQLWDYLYLGAEGSVIFDSLALDSDTRDLYTDLGPEIFNTTTNTSTQLNEVQYALHATLSKLRKS